MIHRRNLLLAAILVIALHCPSFDCRPHDANRQTRSVGSSSDGHIFTARLGDEAPRNLGNPCGSSSRSSESSMGLGVSSGREAMLRGMAQNMLAAVRHLNASLVRYVRVRSSASAPNTVIHSNEFRPEADPALSRFTANPNRICL